MKILLAVAFGAAATLFLLYSGVTPWRIMSREEIEALELRAAAAEKRAAAAEPAKGSWMFDPRYRTALDKP
jgi:hypothetical protein